MLLRGVDDNGDPVDVPACVCPGCGALIVLSDWTLDEHAAAAHPA